jgi:HSP20 family protein
LSDDDWRDEWFRKRGWWPFSRRWMFEDVDKIFMQMEEIMQREFKQASEKAPKELVRERTLPDGRKVKEWGPFVYGYSMTIGPEGEPQIREFGNFRPETRRGKPRVTIKERREPLVDVLETNGQIRVVAELPGVEKRDIKLHGTADTLTISVNTAERKYHKEVKLPAKTNPKTAKSFYKNGVLEVTLAKAEEQPQGESIKID